jgi:hypothetical protein
MKRIAAFAGPLILSYLILNLVELGQVILPAYGDVLQGGVQEEDYLHPNRVPSLNRGDLKNGNDPFSSGDTAKPSQEILEPAQGAFDVQSLRPAKPPPDFNLRADEAQPPDFNGTPMQATPETSPTAMVPTAGPTYNPAEQSGEVANDPDKTPEMQLAWDAWHQRVASTVYQRFVTISHAAFQYSRPLAAYVSYTVTRDGRVINTQLQQKSSNVAFNAMVLLVVNSLSGQRDVLAFPPGSRRSTVEKGGMFTENYLPQQGFKFTTGDRETIPSHSR